MLERILLIDDSEGEALFVQQMLKQAGLDDPILWLSDAESAMAYFNGEGKFADRRRYCLPEVVLLDLKMPKVDGYQFLRWLRAQGELTGVIIVVLTGEMDAKLIQLAYQLGATSFLSKGANVEEFRNFVEFFRRFSRVAHRMPRDAEQQAQSGERVA